MPIEPNKPISELNETKEDKDIDFVVIERDGENYKKSTETRNIGATTYVEDNLQPFQFKNFISVASDFPTLSEVKNGFVYKVLQNVTDNDVTKTNTGISFNTGDTIVWESATWITIATGSKVELEASGVLSGGEVTQTSTTTFNVNEGAGQIINYVSKTITPVTWTTQTGVLPAFLTDPEAIFTFLYFDSVGTLQQRDTAFTAELYDNSIPIGQIAHIYPFPGAPASSKFIIAATNSFRRYLGTIGSYGAQEAYDLTTTFLQKVKIIPAGGLNIGLESAESGLEGLAKLIGAGNNEDPNYISVPNVATYPQVLFAYRDPNEVVIAYPDSFPTPTGEIDPTQYNPKGSNLETVPSGYWSVQRIYVYPNGNIPVVMYGRDTYPTKREAMNNFNKEEFNVIENSRKYLLSGALVTYLVVRSDATDLTTKDFAEFIPADDIYGIQEIDTINSGLIVGGTLSKTATPSLNYAWAFGRSFDRDSGLREQFISGAGTVNNNAITHVIWDNVDGQVKNSPIRAIAPQVQIGTFGANSGDIVELIQQPPLNTREYEVLEGLAEIFPVVVENGLIITPDPDPTLNLDVILSAGEYRQNIITKQSISQIVSRVTPLIRYFKVGGVWTTSTSQEADLTQYQNGDDLASVPSNRSSYIVFLEIDEPFSGTHKIGMVYADAIYLSEQDAIDAASAININGFSNLPPGLEYNARSTAYVFAGQDTAFDPAGSSTWIDIRQRAGIGGGGGAGAQMLEGDQVFILRVNGNDGLNGKNWDKAFATFSAAVSAANALAPTKASVVCQDSGTFSVPPLTSIGANVSVYMPNADLIGTLAIQAGAYLNIGRAAGLNITLGDLGVAADYAYISVKDMQSFNSNRIIVNSSSVGNLVLNAGEIECGGTSSCVYVDNATSKVDIDVRKIELVGTSGSIGVNIVSGECNATIGNIYKNASASNTTGVKIGATGILRLNLNGVNEADTKYDVTAGGSLYIYNALYDSSLIEIDNWINTVTVLESTTNTMPATVQITNTDGREYLAVVVTPKNANNILEIEASVLLGLGADITADYITAAVFKDSEVNPFMVRGFFLGTVGTWGSHTWTKRIVAGTTSSIVFRCRCGARTAGTSHMNGAGGVVAFGGDVESYLRVRELAKPSDII
jgi:hypothetical protein